MKPIGVIHTCFTEKFGVPRQPLMAMEARGVIRLNSDPKFAEAVHLLDTFSHIWVIFKFHKGTDKPWRPRIEPPRTGELKTVGVFASRSPHRPNPIGMSVVKLDKILIKDEIEIHVSGVDILDGTPVLDIKPYLPYADSVPTADAGWAKDELKKYTVEFSEECLAQIRESGVPRLQNLLEDILCWDPRPRSQRELMPIESNEGNIFRFRLLQFDVEWQITRGKLKAIQLHHI